MAAFWPQNVNNASYNWAGFLSSLFILLAVCQDVTLFINGAPHWPTRSSQRYEHVKLVGAVIVYWIANWIRVVHCSAVN